MELLGLISGNLMKMSEENIKNITKSDKNFPPTFVDHHVLPDITFIGHCFIKHNVSIPKIAINLYIYYTLNPQLWNLNMILH